MMAAAAIAATITGCTDYDIQQDYNPLIDKPQTEEPAPEQPGEEANSRNEQYRPQIHYTPAKNWINDPNGMIYLASLDEHDLRRSGADSKREIPNERPVEIFQVPERPFFHFKTARVEKVRELRERTR